MAAIVRTLSASGYGGWLSLELVHRPATGAQRPMVEAVRRSVAYLRELVSWAQAEPHAQGGGTATHWALGQLEPDGASHERREGEA